MLESASKVNFNFNFGASPCVPATAFETSGDSLDISDIKQFLSNPNINHLGEVMAFPSVINGDEEILDLGMKILIREDSAAKDFEALSPLIDTYYEDLMFCSDDRHPHDLVKEHINSFVVRAMKKENNLFKVLQIACINPIKHYCLDVGQLRVGDKADFIEVQNLKDFKIRSTVINGELICEGLKTKIKAVKNNPINNFNIKTLKVKDFLFESGCEVIEVIQVIDHELFTKEKNTIPTTKVILVQI